MSQSEWLAYEARRGAVASNSDGVSDESELHRQVRDFCDGQWPRWKFIHARMDKRSTIDVGACDFTIFMPLGKVLCVELKAAKKKLSFEQAAWRKEMEMIGHTVHVVTSMQEFLALVK